MCRRLRSRPALDARQSCIGRHHRSPGNPASAKRDGTQLRCGTIHAVPGQRATNRICRRDEVIQ